MYTLLVVLTSFTIAAGTPSQFAGTHALGERIIGGQPVSIEDYNYQASLLYSGRHICGAVIISPDVVLTTAYCTERYDSSLLQVRAGSSLRDTGGTIVQVSEIYVHPYYDNLFISCDIAVLRLSTPFIFSDTIGSIPLALANDSLPVAEEGVVSGWGSLEEGGSPADDLQAVVVPIISREECRVLLPNYAIDVSMVCAGYAEGGRDACGSDTGGPLTIDGVLYGLVSWGFGCARPNVPGVYAYIPYLREFIEEVVDL